MLDAFIPGQDGMHFRSGGASDNILPLNRHILKAR